MFRNLFFDNICLPWLGDCLFINLNIYLLCFNLMYRIVFKNWKWKIFNSIFMISLSLDISTISWLSTIISKSMNSIKYILNASDIIRNNFELWLNDCFYLFDILNASDIIRNNFELWLNDCFVYLIYLNFAVIVLELSSQ